VRLQANFLTVKHVVFVPVEVLENLPRWMTPLLPVLLTIISEDIHLKTLVNWQIALPPGSRHRGAQRLQSARTSCRTF
jgi:hypothetical protein